MGSSADRWWLALLLVGGLGSSACRPRTESAVLRANLVLVTLDTTRADHLKCYGYRRATTPRLDELAKSSVLFERAYSTSSWTAPSHASLFTGLLPRNHGCHMMRSGGKERMLPLAADAVTLAELLRDAGWATAGFVGGPAIVGPLGFSQGFEVYDDTWEGHQRAAAAVNESAFRWLDARDDRPFFLFLNYFDAHGPYEPDPTIDYPFGGPPSSAEAPFFSFSPGTAKRKGGPFPEGETEVRSLLNRYDQEIYSADHQLDALIAKLRAIGEWERTLLIVTSDHGEAFDDPVGDATGWGHGLMPYRHQCRVPLVIRFPAGAHGGRRILGTVSNVDVFGAALVSLSVELPEGAEEGDLLAAVAGRATLGQAFSEKYTPTAHGISLWSDDFQLLDVTMLNTGQTIQSLIDLNDPSGRRGLRTHRLDDKSLALSAADRARARTLVRRLEAERDQYLERFRARGNVEGSGARLDGSKLDPATAARLRALGYLE